MLLLMENDAELCGLRSPYRLPIQKQEFPDRGV